MSHLETFLNVIVRIKEKGYPLLVYKVHYTLQNYNRPFTKKSDSSLCFCLEIHLKNVKLPLLFNQLKNDF